MIMKKINPLLMLLILCILGACSDDALESLAGKYDMDRYVFKSVEHKETEKLKKGIKVLNMTFSNETNTLELCVGSSEWTLQSGSFSLVETITAKNQFSAVIDGVRTAVSGDLEVTLIETTYYISGLLTDASGSRFKVDYKGGLTFEIGVDDPEASGYTAIVSVQPVYQTDQSGQVTGVVQGVQKYTFSINDPDGNTAALFDAVNAENLDATALAGEYTIQGSPSESWLMDSGWTLPAEWGGWSGGSFVVAGGAKQFITGGKITISVADGIEGDKLFSFSGEGLTTIIGMDATGNTTPGTATEVDIRYVTLQ